MRRLGWVVYSNSHQLCGTVGDYVNRTHGLPGFACWVSQNVPSTYMFEPIVSITLYFDKVFSIIFPVWLTFTCHVRP